MGVGNIFVATTLAPLVIVLASVSLQLLTIGLEQLKNCECPVCGRVSLSAALSVSGVHFAGGNDTLFGKIGLLRIVPQR